MSVSILFKKIKLIIIITQKVINNLWWVVIKIYQNLSI